MEVENWDSNSRLVVEDGNGKFRPNPLTAGPDYIRFFTIFISTLHISFLTC